MATVPAARAKAMIHIKERRAFGGTCGFLLGSPSRNHQFTNRDLLLRS